MISDLLLSGTTVLLTTHQLIEASALADRLAILRNGRIVGLGTPEQLAATRPARITFHLPAVPPLPDLPQVVATINSSGDRHPGNPRPPKHPDRASSPGPASNDLQLHDLTARPASLEEAFLAITESSEETGRMTRVVAVGKAEGILLLRNALMLLIALLLPVGTVLVLQPPRPARRRRRRSGRPIITAVTVVTLDLFVYYQLVTALVARREELVLKRLRTGELSDWRSWSAPRRRRWSSPGPRSSCPQWPPPSGSRSTLR